MVGNVGDGGGGEDGGGEAEGSAAEKREEITDRMS